MKKIILILALIILSGCSNQIPETLDETNCAPGNWNWCSSECLGTDAELCNLQCYEQCECGFDGYECPEGYECKIGSFSYKGKCVRIS